MMNTKRGFTLLEVMIVLVIMATLTVLSSQSIQQAIRQKIKLQDQIDDVSRVRDALKVIERDINLAFHFTDLEVELKEAIRKKRLELCKNSSSTTTTVGEVTTTTNSTPTTQVPSVKPGCNPNDPNDPLKKEPENRIDPTTHFVGKDDAVYFPTMNSSRLTEGTQADFVKVAYLIQGCKKPGSDSGSGSCLVRRHSNVVEGDITEGGENVVLLEDVTEFKLRYYGRGKQDWVSDWDSKKGDAVAKGRFPDALEISLTTETGTGEKKKKISMQIVVPIRFPNNSYQDGLNAKARAQLAQPPGDPNGDQQNTGDGP